MSQVWLDASLDHVTCSACNVATALDTRLRHSYSSLGRQRRFRHFRAVMRALSLVNKVSS